MATIQTAIELYDGLTAPMMNIINAVQMGISSMYEYVRNAGSNEQSC